MPETAGGVLRTPWRCPLDPGPLQRWAGGFHSPDRVASELLQLVQLWALPRLNPRTAHNALFRLLATEVATMRVVVGASRRRSFRQLPPRTHAKRGGQVACIADRRVLPWGSARYGYTQDRPPMLARPAAA